MGASSTGYRGLLDQASIDERSSKARLPLLEEQAAAVTSENQPSALPASPQSTTLPKIAYFALGDSVASGHGLLDDGKAICHRSPRAYPYKLAEMLHAAGVEVDFNAAHHIACSGARSADLTDQVNQVIIQAGKLPEEQPVLVTITIGANDFQWTNVPNFVDKMFLRSKNDFNKWVRETAGGVRSAVDTEVKRLLDIRPNVVVIVTDYFNPVNRLSLLFLDPLDGMSRCDQAINDLNIALVNGVKSRASTGRVRGTSTIRGAFLAHESPGDADAGGLCGWAPPGLAETYIQYPGDPQSNSITSSKFSAPHVVGTDDCFQPNNAGAATIAAEIVPAVISLLPALVPAAKKPKITSGPIAHPGVDEATIEWTTDQEAIL